MRRLIVSILLFMLCFCGSLQPAYAFDPFGFCNQAGAGNSAVCNGKSNTDPLTGTNGVILKITNIVAIVAGIAAVIILIIGGLRYVTSGGDSGSVASAKSTIIYALIGLVVIALAKTIIAYVVSKV